MKADCHPATQIESLSTPYNNRHSAAAHALCFPKAAPIIFKKEWKKKKMIQILNPLKHDKMTSKPFLFRSVD